MEEIQHGNKYECKETCIFYILSITSSTNFNNFIFESSSEEADDHTENGFVGEQTDQRESVSLDKLTGIRLRDVNMTKVMPSLRDKINQKLLTFKRPPSP